MRLRTGSLWPVVIIEKVTGCYSGNMFSLSSNTSTRASNKFVKVFFSHCSFKDWRNKIKICNESVEDLGEGSGETSSPPFLEAKLRSAGPK